MLFEYPLFLSIKACRVRGGKTLRVPDKKLDIGERSATRSGRFTTYASWKPSGPQNYSGCWWKQKNEISVWTNHSTSGAITAHSRFRKDKDKFVPTKAMKEYVGVVA